MTPAATNIITCPECGTKNRVHADAKGTPRCAKSKTPLPWVTEANDSTFASVVTDSKLPVLLDLWAPWCGPCRQVSPVLERLEGEFAGRMKLVKVNVDESPQTAQRYQAMSIPTLLFMRGGKEVSRKVGALPAPQLRQWVQQELAK